MTFEYSWTYMKPRIEISPEIDALTLTLAETECIGWTFFELYGVK